MNNECSHRSSLLRRAIILAALLCSVAATSPLLAVDAGRFIVVVGDVRVLDDNGRAQPAIRGSLLSSGDTVVTGENALAQLSMVDNGRISLRENTEFKLDEYNFKEEEPSAGRMFVNLLRGSFRSLTGLIGTNNRAGYRVRTPHATLGVRGTDHETTVILVPREGFTAGTFDVVFKGITWMRTERGQIEISPRQAGYVAATNPLPRIIKIPAFLEAVPSAQAPVPRTGARSPAAAKPAASSNGSARSSGDSAKQIDRKSMLLNPLTNPKANTLRRTPLESTTPTITRSTTISPTLTDPIKTLSPTLTDPIKTLSPTLTAPIKSISPTLTAPTTTISPTLTAPTTTIIPKLTAPTTTISPTLTAPKTTIIPRLTAPTTTIIPKLTAPTTTIIPKLTAPTTTISPTLTAPKTIISPKLTSPTR